jgi:hypothetical protein
LQANDIKLLTYRLEEKGYKNKETAKKTLALFKRKEGKEIDTRLPFVPDHSKLGAQGSGEEQWKILYRLSPDKEKEKKKS